MVCHSCIRRNRLTNVFVFLGIALATGAFTIWGITSRARSVCALGFLILISGLAAVICFLGFLVYLFQKEQDGGEQMAINLRSPELKKQGFDTFWKPAEYAKLQRTPMF